MCSRRSWDDASVDGGGIAAITQSDLNPWYFFLGPYTRSRVLNDEGNIEKATKLHWYVEDFAMAIFRMVAVLFCFCNCVKIVCLTCVRGVKVVAATCLTPPCQEVWGWCNPQCRTPLVNSRGCRASSGNVLFRRLQIAKKAGRWLFSRQAHTLWCAGTSVQSIWLPVFSNQTFTLYDGWRGSGMRGRGGTRFNTAVVGFDHRLSGISSM